MLIHRTICDIFFALPQETLKESEDAKKEAQEVESKQARERP